MKRPLEMAHDFWLSCDKEDIVVDATMGNNTCLFSQAGKQVYAFDIREQALRKTQRAFGSGWNDKCQLILKGHETASL